MIAVVRIATWNLAGKGSPRHIDFLAGLEADVLLLTEVPPDLVLPGFALTPPSTAMRPGQLYATVASRAPIDQACFPHPASVAARIRGTTYVSSVLPWASAGQDPWRGEGMGQRTVHALDDLAPFLRQQSRLVWGGDWNHTLSGTLQGCSRAGRVKLEALLRELGLQVPTQDLPRGLYAMASIDHIALADPAATAAPVSAECDGMRLSDHDAYVVTTHG